MKSNFLNFYLLIFLLFGFACKPPVAIQSSTEKNSKRENISASVSPNACKIIGTVIRIDSVLSVDTASPCSKVPCSAVVRVEEVISCGVGFGSRLNNGNEIEIYFALTLSPINNELFPNLDLKLPGLKVGSKFMAEVESRKMPMKKGMAFLVYDYRLK